MHTATTNHGKLLPLTALIAVTMVWGVTFVQVKSALSAYPLLAFLTIRFAIATAALAPFGFRRLRQLGRRGLAAGVATGVVIAAAFLLQGAGLERTSVSATGFITGTFVVLTPIVSVVLFRAHIGRAGWLGVAVATLGLALLAGVHGGAITGDALVLSGAVLFALQTVLMERFASFDARPLTLVQMITATIVLAIAAVVHGHVPAPHSAGLISALLVTGVFASAIGFLAQNWAQQQITATQTALSLSLEPVWTAIFGVILAGDQLGISTLCGSALIMAGLIISEPATTTLLTYRLKRRIPPHTGTSSSTNAAPLPI